MQTALNLRQNRISDEENGEKTACLVNLSLLVGAALVWLLQLDSGYILISTAA